MYLSVLTANISLYFGPESAIFIPGSHSSCNMASSLVHHFCEPKVMGMDGMVPSIVQGLMSFGTEKDFTDHYCFAPLFYRSECSGLTGSVRLSQICTSKQCHASATVAQALSCVGEAQQDPLPSHRISIGKSFK